MIDEGSIAISITVPITNQTCQKFPTDIVQKIVVPPDRYKFYCLLRTQKRLSSFSSLFIFCFEIVLVECDFLNRRKWCSTRNLRHVGKNVIHGTNERSKTNNNIDSFIQVEWISYLLKVLLLTFSAVVKISRQNNNTLRTQHLVRSRTSWPISLLHFCHVGLQELWSLWWSWKWRRTSCGSAVLTNVANAGNFWNNFALRVIDDETRKVGLLIA